MRKEIHLEWLLDLIVLIPRASDNDALSSPLLSYANTKGTPLHNNPGASIFDAPALSCHFCTGRRTGWLDGSTKCRTVPTRDRNLSPVGHLVC